MRRSSNAVVRPRTTSFHIHARLISFLLGIVAVIVLCSPACAQEGQIIQEIEVQGLETISREKVLYALPIQVGKPYRPREPGEIIHAIHDLGYFQPDIRVFTEDVEGGVKVIIVVKENQQVSEVSFVGNTQIPEKTLQSVSPVKEGELFAPDAAVRIRAAVEKAYRAKGYTNASVLVTEVDRGTTQVAIQVVVDEGKKLKTRDVVIRGNDSVAAPLLRLQMENKGSWLFFKNFYDSEMFLTDLDMIRLYYLSRGFLDVSVKAGEFIYDPDGEWVSPVIEIEEGPRYRVGEIRPSGYTLFMRDEIVEPFEEIQGEYYSAESFQRCLQEVKNLYGDEGYINAEVSFSLRTDPKRGIADVDLRIDEHNRVYVRKIAIRKNELPLDDETFIEKLHGALAPPVTDEVIEREVLLESGQPYRRFQQVASVDRLRSLGIFNRVEAEAALTDDESQRDMVLTVEEGNSGNIIFGVGLSEWAGAYLHGGYVNRNLFGEARHLRTSFLLGTRDIQVRIGYLDRYFDFPGERLDRFFQTDPSGLVPFRAEIFRESLYLREYMETHTGVSAVVSRLRNRGIVTEDYGVRLEYVETDDEGRNGSSRWGDYFDLDDSDSEESDEDFDDYPVAAVNYYIEENTTDDWWWPTRGHILGGGAEVGVADGPLLKLTGRYSTYKRLHDKLIYALNSKLGWMPLDADEVGISERLFMGGANDMRGFAFRGAGPVDDLNDDLHIGGSLKLVAQNELRFPIYRQLNGFVFSDVGMLAEDPFELDSPRVSAGAGLRFSTSKTRVYGPRWQTGPTGLDLMNGFNIEVSLGAPLVDESDDEEQYLHFIVGSSF